MAQIAAVHAPPAPHPAPPTSTGGGHAPPPPSANVGGHSTPPPSANLQAHGVGGSFDNKS